MKQRKRKMTLRYVSFLSVVVLFLNVTSVANANEISQFKGASKQVGLAADFNRDGVIELTENKPFVFWINNDNDNINSETSGEDIKVILDPDTRTKFIDGTRDLIDFFAVGLDLYKYLTTTNIDKKKFFLQHDDAAINIVYTQMSRGVADDSQPRASDYLKKINNSNVVPIFGSWQTNGPLLSVKVRTVTSEGIEIPKEFIQSIIDDENKGVILVEGNSETTKPLKLIVKDENNNIVADAELPIRIYEVEKLFRQVSLRDNGRDEDSTKWGVNRVATPDVAALLTDLSTQSTNIQSIVPAEIDMNNHVIFLHGFNVTFNQAREAQSEVFKRLYHSGSNALFTGVHWNGDAGLINPTNYWYDVENAFYIADDFSAIVSGIKGSSGNISIIAHSLGNMVAGLAIQDFTMPYDNYFMLNPAVATEAYKSVTNAKNMRHPDWDDYYFGDNYQVGVEAENYDGVRDDGKNGRFLWSTEWFKFFTDIAGDDRKTLTWRDRLDLVGKSNKVVQYFSSGEEVLVSAGSGGPPLSDAFPDFPFFFGNVFFGLNAWNIQEKSKGTGNLFALLALNSSAGWGFNSNCYIPPPFDVTVLCNDLLHDQAETYFFNASIDQLITQPFFERFDENGLMELSFNQDAFNNSYPRVMAFDIPALSYAAGGTRSAAFPLLRTEDMNTEMFDDWPAERGGKSVINKWRHSDFKDVSYRYTYLLYDNLVFRGGLK